MAPLCTWSSWISTIFEYSFVHNFLTVSSIALSRTYTSWSETDHCFIVFGKHFLNYNFRVCNIDVNCDGIMVEQREFSCHIFVVTWKYQFESKTILTRCLKLFTVVLIGKFTITIASYRLSVSLLSVKSNSNSLLCRIGQIFEIKVFSWSLMMHNFF